MTTTTTTNDSVYYHHEHDFTLSDLSPNQMRDLELKLSVTNPKLPSYILQNLRFCLQVDDGDNYISEEQTPTTTTSPSSLFLHLQRFYPNLKISYLITIFRVHLCHDFANYLRYHLVRQLVNEHIL